MSDDHAKELTGIELRIEEMWEGGPDAVPLPEHVITSEGAFWPDGVTPFEITDEQMRAAGWKKRRRLVSDWVDA
jgi:hypothetical protein